MYSYCLGVCIKKVSCTEAMEGVTSEDLREREESSQKYRHITKELVLRQFDWENIKKLSIHWKITEIIEVKLKERLNGT